MWLFKEKHDHVFMTSKTSQPIFWNLKWQCPSFIIRNPWYMSTHKSVHFTTDGQTHLWSWKCGRWYGHTFYFLLNFGHKLRNQLQEWNQNTTTLEEQAQTGGKSRRATYLRYTNLSYDSMSTSLFKLCSQCGMICSMLIAQAGPQSRLIKK